LEVWLQEHVGAILIHLMGENETGTLGVSRDLRQNLLQPSVSIHRGEVVKSMGDGGLAEFASLV
jgi:class 3 adenylate cyclase